MKKFGYRALFHLSAEEDELIDVEMVFYY